MRATQVCAASPLKLASRAPQETSLQGNSGKRWTRLGMGAGGSTPVRGAQHLGVSWGAGDSGAPDRG